MTSALSHQFTRESEIRSMGFGIGEQVGPYEIVQCIGQGGMATIYKARQTALDRFVAIKVIHPALKDDPSFLMRLSREATIVGKLNHPNIVPVYDFGEYGGMPYLVMRYIDGKSLKTILTGSGLKTQDIITIARPIASALQYAHEHGVLHRDVKPSNVLFDSEGTVYLTDFGLARFTNSGESTLSRDMLIGSPLYISPEQARGDPVDERSDVYSFGIVLYEMFTGRVPFIADTTYATIMAQISDPLPSPRSFNSRIPRAVEIVLAKALAKRAEDRYPGPNELITALENAAVGPSRVMNGYAASSASTLAPRIAAPPVTTNVNKPMQYGRELSCLRTLIIIIAFLLALYFAAACVITVGLQFPWDEFAPFFSSLAAP